MKNIHQKSHDSSQKAPKRRYTTSDQEKIDSFRKKMQYEAWIPATLFIGEWRRTIGPAFPLLCALLCAADWKTGRWRGNEWVLAEVFGVSSRTIVDWIRRIKKVSDVEYRKYPYSIQLIFPPRMRTRFGDKKSAFMKDRHVA